MDNKKYEKNIEKAIEELRNNQIHFETPIIYF